jgi:ubiquinol-cytochrome c reductase cytochrome c1 subunit
MNRISYRNLVGVCYSEAEAKALAEEITVVDGPNDSGEMFERPGKLSDRFPSPYKNEEQARSINNGALPPDLSLIGKARGRGEDYIFALLTGYKEPPAGVVVNTAGGQHYNPYFAGGKIGMAKQLVDGAVDYPDGTPATASQMAKDVAVFLAWAAEPDQDVRKEAGLKWILAVATAAALTGYYKRFRWGPLKVRQATWDSAANIFPRRAAPSHPPTPLIHTHIDSHPLSPRLTESQVVLQGLIVNINLIASPPLFLTFVHFLVTLDLASEHLALLAERALKLTLHSRALAKHQKILLSRLVLIRCAATRLLAVELLSLLHLRKNEGMLGSLVG